MKDLLKYLVEYFMAPMAVVGLLGQLIFTSRFVVQWIASERKGESVMPIAFWYLSMVGNILLLSYAIWRRDPVFIMAQMFGSIVYSRNLMLIFRKKKLNAEV